MKNYGCIYKITNKLNGKCYIGATINPKGRFRKHRMNFDPSIYTFTILAEYDSYEELDAMERYWIWRYKAFEEGYNKNKGGYQKSYIKKKIKSGEQITIIKFNKEEYEMIEEIKRMIGIPQTSEIIRLSLYKYYHELKAVQKGEK